MPLDLNTYDLDSLTDKVHQLRPGQAAVSNDGMIIRRRQNSSGFDCGVGRGGHAHSKKNTAIEAAEYMLGASARFAHPKALGGMTQFSSVDAAIESVRRGETTSTGPSPAVQALRTVASKAGLHSYRIRAQRARDALAKGNIASAVRNLEAIVEHAQNTGRQEDVRRAQAALNTVHDNHDFDAEIPKLMATKIEIKTIGDHHYVYQNGTQMAGPLVRREAESRLGFLTRKAAKEEDIATINKELAGEAVLVSEAEQEEDAAA